MLGVFDLLVTKVGCGGRKAKSVPPYLYRSQVNQYIGISSVTVLTFTCPKPKTFDQNPAQAPI